MKDDVKLTAPLRDQTITTAEAIFRTTQWRTLYKDTMKCKDEEILRAFLIPIEDIIELYNFYKEHTELNITAVRGYMGHNPIGPVSPDMNIDFLMVPVTADGKDVLEVPPQLLKLGGTSTVYDFSTPCPPTCDPTSPLYASV